MRKSINLALNKYTLVPDSLKSDPAKNTPIDEIDVDLARLFHHYYLDTRGHAPPNPDPAQFEYLSLFLPCTELRVRGDGFGISVTFRQATSNQLGQAFCRWFLYEHLDITYFAHMKAVLDRKAHPNFGGHEVQRVSKGDAPDYLCAQTAHTVFLAEAKGRTRSISFGNPEFEKWREQFKRVVVKDASGRLCSVKGHIVATRFATEEDGPRIKSQLFAEDPASPGEIPISEAPGLGAAVIALHYSDIAAKIRQPILAASLATGVTVPDEIQFLAMVWEFNGPVPSLHKKRFVGGYFGGGQRYPSVEIRRTDEDALILNADPLRLDLPPVTFFGVEETIFKNICSIARAGDMQASQLNQLPNIPFFDSGSSVFRDGSIIASAHYFRPIALQVYR